MRETITGFEQLVQPVGADDFFANHFGRAPLHIPGQPPAYSQTTVNRNQRQIL